MVIAVDTNVVARFLVQDDAAQAATAEKILASGAFVSLTVLLETAWLLRSHYGMTRLQVGDALNVLLALEGIEVSDADLIRWAIDRAVTGADIADMVHLVAARHHGTFATFDGGIEKAAGPAAPLRIETLA